MTESFITILYVDDNEGLIDLFQEYVQSHEDDIALLTARNGQEALDVLKTSDNVDCVISDYRMPGMNGLELLEVVRRRWSEIPFILFTGQGDENIAERAISTGVADYLQKGVGTKQFADVVDRTYDVMAPKQAETELKRASQRTEAEFKLLVDIVEEYAIFFLDEDGYIQTWNRGAEKIKGYTQDEIVGKHFSIFYLDEDIEAGVPGQNLHRASTEGRAVDEGWRVRKDGSQFWADVVIRALREEGDLIGYAKVTRDTTQRHREQELLDQKEQLENIIAAISHDLRNPLNVVGGNIQLARETGDLSRLDDAEQALERATRLLNYIREVAAEGEHILEPVPVDLREVADEAWSVIDTDSAERVVEKDVTLKADRWRLQQVLENLFENAVNHARPKVTISIGPLDGGGFYVEDDGPGIDETERSKVFEMGYSGEDGGTGFGLAICKQIAEAHGWDLEVTDGTEGGARFEVLDVELA